MDLRPRTAAPADTQGHDGDFISLHGSCENDACYPLGAPSDETITCCDNMDGSSGTCQCAAGDEPDAEGITCVDIFAPTKLRALVRSVAGPPPLAASVAFGAPDCVGGCVTGFAGRSTAFSPLRQADWDAVR